MGLALDNGKIKREISSNELQGAAFSLNQASSAHLCPGINPMNLIPVIPPITISIALTDSINVCGKYRFRFNATVTNQQSALSFIWLKNGDAVLHTNNPIADIEDLNQQDIITCVVTETDDCSRAAASNAIVMNFVPLPVLSVSIAEINRVNVCGSFRFTYIATVNNSQGDVAITWFKNGIQLPDITGSTVDLDGLTQNNIITCKVTETNPCSRVVSSNAIPVSFTPIPQLSLSISETNRVNICDGFRCTYIATVNNNQGDFIITWFKNGTEVPNETGLSATFDLVIGNSISCKVTETNPCNRVRNTLSTIIIGQTVPLTVSVSSTPNQFPVCPQSLVFTATVNGGIGPYTYQWKNGNADIIGATNASFAYESQQAATIKCDVRDVCNRTATSNSIPVSFSQAPARPGVISGATINVCGLIKRYTVPKVTGLSYVWTVPNGASILGVTTGNSIRVQFTESFQEGNISVASKNSCDLLSTTERTLNIKGIPYKAVVKFKRLNTSIIQSTYKATVLKIVSPLFVAVPPEQYKWVIKNGSFIVNGLTTNDDTIITNDATITFSVRRIPTNLKFKLCVTKINSCGESLESCYFKSQIDE